MTYGYRRGRGSAHLGVVVAVLSQTPDSETGAHARDCGKDDQQGVGAASAAAGCPDRVVVVRGAVVLAGAVRQWRKVVLLAGRGLGDGERGRSGERGGEKATNDQECSPGADAPELPLEFHR